MWYFAAFFFSSFLMSARSRSAWRDLTFRSVSVRTSAASPCCRGRGKELVSSRAHWDGPNDMVASRGCC